MYYDDHNAFLGFLDNIDTIFYGRISYELWGQFQPNVKMSQVEKQIWKAVHSKDKYVFSAGLKGDKGNMKFISSDIEAKVKEIKNKSGNNIWLYGGAKLIRGFMEMGLIDEYRLAVHPIILGSGKPLFSKMQNRGNLKLKALKCFKSGVVILSYEAA